MVQSWCIVLYQSHMIVLSQMWTTFHDEVIKWKHMPRHWPFLSGIHRSPVTKASDAELWSAPKQPVEQTIETQAIWDAIAVIITIMHTKRCKHVDTYAHAIEYYQYLRSSMSMGMSMSITTHTMYISISQEICTRFCCALLCCGYAIAHNEFTWSIYPYSSGLLCWHWGNRQIATVPVK